MYGGSKIGNGGYFGSTSGYGVQAASSSGTAGYFTSSNVGVYISAPTGLEVVSTMQAGAFVATAPGSVAVFASATGSGSIAGQFEGNVTINGSIVTPSDERLKTNIQPLKDSLDKLLQLRGVSYEWKEPALHGSNDGTRRGFIAQEVLKVFPEWVGTSKDGFLNLDQTGLGAVTVEAIRTLKSEMDAEKKRADRAEAANEQLKKRTSDNEDRLDRLERGHALGGQAPWFNNPAFWGSVGVLAGLGLASSWRKRVAT